MSLPSGSVHYVTMCGLTTDVTTEVTLDYIVRITGSYRPMSPPMSLPYIDRT